MKKYDNYKDSGIEYIGEIPEHWEVKKTFHHFKAEKGKNASLLTKEYCGTIEGNYPVYSGQTENNGIMSLIKEYEFDFSEDGCLLSTTVGAKAMSVSYLRGKFSLSQNCMIITSRNKNELNNRFFFYQFQPIFKFYRGLIPDHMQPSFRMDDLYQFKIIIPSKIEQTAIANYLDHKTAQIDTLIAKKEHFITLLQEERTAVINHAVTKGLDPKVKMKDSGIEWLGEIPEHWEVKPLKYLVKDLLSGVSVNSHDVPTTNNEEFGILKTSCVYDYTFRPIQNKQVLKEEYNRVRCSVEKDTIIISRMNTPELVGASGYVSKDYPNLFLPDRLWKTEFFNDVEINVKWLSQVLISDLYKKVLSSRATGTSSSMKNISKDDFLTLQIPYSPLEEQNIIAEFLFIEASRVDEIIFKAKQEIELLKEYKTALISEVVTGKVDVRNVILN